MNPAFDVLLLCVTGSMIERVGYRTFAIGLLNAMVSIAIGWLVAILCSNCLCGIAAAVFTSTALVTAYNAN